MLLTPPLCRSARAFLGWTIEELAAASGVGISTIISFEAGQRLPIRANLEALERALSGAGVIFMTADHNGRGLRLTKTAEALRDFLLIGALNESSDARLRRAKQRITRFRTDAFEYYKSIGPSDVEGRVDSDIEKLRERIYQEISRRQQLRREDESTRFLEPLIDYLDG